MKKDVSAATKAKPQDLYSDQDVLMGLTVWVRGRVLASRSPPSPMAAIEEAGICLSPPVRRGGE